MGMCADPGSYRWCQALSRSRSSFATNKQRSAAPTESAAAAAAPAKHITARSHNNRLITIINNSNSNRNSDNDRSSTKQQATILATSQAPTHTDRQHNTTDFEFEKAAEGHRNISSDCSRRQDGATVRSLRNIASLNELQLLKPFQLILLGLLVLLARATQANANLNNIPEDAVHITAILGEGVIFNCHVEFPNDHPVPYVLQWDKKGSDLPIYIWYESYPEHIEEGYKGRVSRVSQDSPFGSASLNLTNIKESDQGWYECKVVFLNRDPKQHKNGTWFHLDVHAPPRFSVTPEDIIYVNLGDSIILNCQADGTPTPEILWYKDANPVDPSPTVGIFNDGTELRISTIRHEDIGEYTCIARNGEGQVSHTARVIIAGGAVIMSTSGNARAGKPPPSPPLPRPPSSANKVIKASDNTGHGITVPPTNQTKLEGEKVIFTCEAKAMPGNVTVRWFREGSLVREVPSLETRITIRKDGSLIINPVSADDSGQYLCEVTNGIGDPQSASAYLNVEYPAKVTFTPTVQYLPFRLAGIVQCVIKSNPPLQYVTWTKDKRLLEPYQMKDIVVMANGSLLFTRVNEDHQGRYTCTPYNAQGTQGSSGPMEVLVRKPPTFTVEPEPLYQRKVGDSVEMHCDAVEAEGTSKPTIKWQRQEGDQLSDSQRNRIKISVGNLTIENLRREDFGYYQCVVSNEVATIMSATQLVIEGTQPHAPYNITGKATESSITLQWMPGYSGGSEYKQDYTIWYREAGVSDWQTISVTPSGSTQVTINGLASGTTYEFQVVGRNVLGDGMMSKVMTVRTLEVAPDAPRNVKAATQPPDHVFQLMPDDADLLAPFDIYFHTDSNGSIVYSPPKLKLKGPKPGPPRNVSVTEVSNGFMISWQAPLERAHIVKFYTIKYRTDAQWKTLNRGQIRPEDMSYLVKNLVGGRTYYFRVLANSEKSYESSDEVKFPVPARVKHKAITAGVVGGILFFIVAIILSVCAVKICNKRKRRKQEKEFNMVACRITDARNIAANNHHLRSRSTGSISGGQVPLKKYEQARISSLTAILIAILHWIWPPDRCTNCHSIYSSPHLDDDAEARRRSVSQIQRSVDGRFVLGEAPTSDKTQLHAITNGAGDDTDEVDAPIQRCNSSSSQKSSSDDGGFLSRRSFITARASWRRPLVASPSQLSLQSAADSARGFLQGLGGLLRLGATSAAGVSNNRAAQNLNATNSGARYQNINRSHYGHPSNIYRNLQPQLNVHPHQQTLQHTTPAAANHLTYGPHTLPRHQNFYTPSRVSRIFSSSPAASPSGAMGLGSGVSYIQNATLAGSPWALASPQQAGQLRAEFSDLSSVYPSSNERSFPTPNATSGNLSRYRYHAQELPSLRTIQEETRRMNQQQEHEHQHQQHQQLQQQQHSFVPLQVPSPPPWRSFYPSQSAYHSYSYRPRTRWYPRHYSRLFGRSQSELMSPLPHLNLNIRSGSAISAGFGLEASPESRSSSSGFGSKNTSNHLHGSHAGSTSEWRLLPPYRPPPPPPANTAYFGSQANAQSSQSVAMPPPLMAQASVSPHHQYNSSTLPYYTSSAPAGSMAGYYTSQRPITPPYTMAHWLEMISRLNAATDNVNLPKSVDVGSVDGHYEFDPATPTPSASTPIVGLLRDDLNFQLDGSTGFGHHALSPPNSSSNALTGGGLGGASAGAAAGAGSGGGGGSGIFHTSTSGMPYSTGSIRNQRSSRYDNIEARLQAMKEEFYAYRKRQAMSQAGVAELESVC